jgi:hypothetical protein
VVDLVPDLEDTSLIRVLETLANRMFVERVLRDLR